MASHINTAHQNNLELMSSKAVAKMLNITPDCIKKSRCTGLLMGFKAPPHYKFGHRVRYDINDVNDWIAARKVVEGLK